MRPAGLEARALHADILVLGEIVHSVLTQRGARSESELLLARIFAEYRGSLSQSEVSHGYK